MVLFALCMVVLLVLAGSAYDYGSIVVENAQLQNAVDAGVLAGADSLGRSASLPGGTPVAVARATTSAYLALNGAATQTPGTTITYTFPTSTPVAGATSASVIENMSVTVSRVHQTVFWPIVGINNVTTQGAGGAHASRNMLDIMLSLDVTGSEIFSGSFTSIQQAVVNFINVVNPSTTDPRGPKIGIARFAGIKCTWYNDAHDGYMHVYSTSTPQSEYRTPCGDDKTVLINLSNDRTALLNIANNSVKHTAYAATEASNSTYAQDICTDGGANCNGGTLSLMPYWPQTPGWVGAPYFTGTKLPNAVTVLSQVDPPPGDPSASYYAWNAVNGGRDDPASGTNAHKVMVMFTDGQNEAWPSALTTPDRAFPEDVSQSGYGNQVQTLAQHLKLGPDQVQGTADDVELFVVGYFCTPYDSSAPGTSASSFCKSQLAATGAPHPCPGPLYPPSGVSTSAIDDLLVSISSSAPGTCDHYYPLSKSETYSLPQLFTALAGTISRGQLTQ
jgi:Flp pilus assembly protein TadG